MAAKIPSPALRTHGRRFFPAGGFGQVTDGRDDGHPGGPPGGEEDHGQGEDGAGGEGSHQCRGLQREGAREVEIRSGVRREDVAEPGGHELAGGGADGRPHDPGGQAVQGPFGDREAHQLAALEAERSQQTQP